MDSPATDLFGEWLAATDGKAHYALGDTFLCGSTAKTTGAPIRKRYGRDDKGAIIVPHCADCKRLNGARWANGGALPACAKTGGRKK